MGHSDLHFPGILERITNGQSKHHFQIHTLQENYSATIEITDPKGIYFLELLEDMGFETIQEKEDIYTVKYET